MSRRETLHLIRRILCLAATPPMVRSGERQLELSFWAEPAGRERGADLDLLSERVHGLALELTLLIQMEVSGLVASPLRGPRRHRVGLGGTPRLRLLEEWRNGHAIDDDPWTLGTPAASREDGFADGLGRVRALAEALELTPGRVTEITRRLYGLIAGLSPEEDPAGLIHGHAQRHVLRPAGGDRLAFHVDRLRGSGRGAIHTPPELAHELVNTLFRLAAGEETPSFLDPACGSGQFLLSAAARLVQAGPGKTSDRADQDLDRLVSLRGLHGVDVDPSAARIAAWNLSHQAARATREILHRGAADRAEAPPAIDIGSALDQLFGRSFPYFLGTQIQVGNALQIEPSTFSPGFLWQRRYPEIFAQERPGFDIVAGNPPWVSYGLRDHLAAPDEERLYYQRLFPAGTQYKLSLYPIFMELALRLCRAGGAHGFLVPDSVLAGHHYSRIRSLLLSTTELCELTLIESGVWPGVIVGHTLMYAVRKNPTGGQTAVAVRNRIVRSAAARGRGSSRSQGDDGPGVSERRSGLSETSVWVPLDHYSPAGQAPLRMYRDEEEMGFFSRIQSSPLRVRDVAWTYSGLIARYGQQSMQSDRPLDAFLLRDPSGRIVLHDPDAREQWREALLSGSQIVEHSIRGGGGYLYWPRLHADISRLYKSGYVISRYESPKVFLRQTGDRLVAAVDRRTLLCLNNIHLVGSKSPADISPLILAGILMSGPLQRAYRISSLESARPLAQVDLKMVEGLPWPSDAAGGPIGLGTYPARPFPPAKRLLRSLDRALAHDDSAALLQVAEDAWRLPDAPYADTSLTGRHVLHVLLQWLLEKLEVASEIVPAKRVRRSGTGALRSRSPGPRPGTSKEDLELYRGLLDGIVSVFFQLTTPTAR
jgi:hypothetical protein